MADMKIQIKNLYKIFGTSPKSVLKHVQDGMSKAELLEKHGHVLGLKDINIDIPAKGISVIMGLSGSGKSTLIRHINRLIEPTAGEMLVDGDTLEPQVLDIALHHHEKVDGSGYPDGLKGEEITRLARMGAICDVYDALTSNRPYKTGWSPGVAIQRMMSWKGHFDPTILQAFIKTLGIYPMGCLVRLESGKLGVVIGQADDSLLKPKVKVFFSAKSKAPIEISEIVLSAKQCTDKIVGLEEPEAWGFKNLDELWQPS